LAKIQGIQAKDRLPTNIAEQLALVLLSRPRHRAVMLVGMTRSLAAAMPDARRARIRRLDGLIPDDQMKGLLEGSGLSDDDRRELADIAVRVGAFAKPEPSVVEADDIPF
jgi:hypothetical protein